MPTLFATTVKSSRNIYQLTVVVFMEKLQKKTPGHLIGLPHQMIIYVFNLVQKQL